MTDEAECWHGSPRGTQKAPRNNDSALNRLLKRPLFGTLRGLIDGVVTGTV